MRIGAGTKSFRYGVCVKEAGGDFVEFLVREILDTMHTNCHKLRGGFCVQRFSYNKIALICRLFIHSISRMETVGSAAALQLYQSAHGRGKVNSLCSAMPTALRDIRPESDISC